MATGVPPRANRVAYAGMIIALCSLALSIIVSIYVHIMVPAITPKPKLSVTSSRSYLRETELETLSVYKIENVGEAHAEDVGFYFEIPKNVVITDLRVRPSYEIIGGGVDQNFVEFRWETIGPKDSVDIYIQNEVKDMDGLIPTKVKVWDATGLILPD